MKKDLYQLAENVETEQDFLTFLEALMLDRVDGEQKEKIYPSSPYEADFNGWENSNIVSFLDAALGWAIDSNKNPKLFKKEENPWKRIAHILHAGKVYE